MSATFYDLMRYAQTGIASPEMTSYDKMKALAMCKAGFPVKTLTGIPPISFQSDGTPLTAWSISGNMVQESVPNPQNPVTPQECGDRTAQLFDISKATVGKYIDSSGNEKTSQIGLTSHSDYIPITSEAQYTLSVKKPEYASFTMSICWYTEEKEFISRNSELLNTPAGVYSMSKTAPNNAAFVIINYFTYETAGDIYCMFNSGSTALPYEPFGYALPLTLAGQTQTVYLDEPLRKIGDYADTVEQDGTVTRRIKKLVLTGSELWLPLWNSMSIKLSDAIDTTKIIAAMSSHYAGKNTVSSASGRPAAYGDNCIFLRASSPIVMLIYDTVNGTDRESFNAYLAEQYAAGTPVCVWYVLETAQTETFTAPTITPAKGANTLTVGTTLQPSEVSITGGIK